MRDWLMFNVDAMQMTDQLYPFILQQSSNRSGLDMKPAPKPETPAGNT